ncbi:MAG: histidine--tRNA ligase [Candidatus Arcticimaribacter sp.]|nr:MAG: histidine--tRNA ligase [Candidatus Arcticimaribacter sp.]
MKPSIPKGTRDFSPKEVAQRNYLKDVLSTSFETYGFEPIETPSFEKTSTLLGKYGEEGDRLIFKILNSGDKLKKANLEALADDQLAAFSNSLSEKALRYDLTVPFARYVVQHQNDISFPFKRYQIQPVWRADRPQHGRFQEFFQCDADTVGSKSLWQEVELCGLYDDVFDKLRLSGACLKINNRKILAGIAEVLGASDQIIDFTVALDKLDKIGQEGVIKELLTKGFSTESIDKVLPLMGLSGDYSSKLNTLSVFLKDSEIGSKGIEELRFVVDHVTEIGLKSMTLDIDVTLARGLNYYTGCIFEVAAPEGVKMGSIGGGGRYDDLTAGFGLKDTSGVGISFGFDRIYLVLEELDLFPASAQNGTQVLFANFGKEYALLCNQMVKTLRDHQIRSEFYPDAAKMKKQFSYANAKGIPLLIVIGPDELASNSFVLKDMDSGSQTNHALDQFLETIRTAL